MSGCGDFAIHDMSLLADPCPLPDQIKKRTLNEKERLIYGPMSGVGGIIYDKDAIYIELGGSHALTKNKVCVSDLVSVFDNSVMLQHDLNCYSVIIIIINTKIKVIL